REATREVVARTAVAPHPLAILAGNDAEAVVLDLVQPLAAGTRLISLGWKARRHEPSRQGTLQHNAHSCTCPPAMTYKANAVWTRPFPAIEGTFFGLT